MGSGPGKRRVTVGLGQALWSATMMRTTLALGLVVLVGCSGNYDMAGRIDSASEAPLGDSGSGSSDSGDLLPPAPWFALDAQVDLVEGEASGLALQIRFLPEDTVLGEVCNDAPTVVSFEPIGSPDPLVFHWWEVVIDPDTGACDAAPRLPSTLRLGLGELYPQVVAGVDQDGLGDVKDSLYGAYASFDAPIGDGLDGTTYAYGYAGTEADRAGATPAVESGPLPDGSYLATAFYLFELLPED